MKRHPEAGNAVVYILIVIALFAALAFLLARGGSNSESNSLSPQQVEIDATQVMQVAQQVKQAVDGMLYSGSCIEVQAPPAVPCHALDFTLPSDSGYNTPPNDQKVFHPAGGGVILGALPATATGTGSDPVPGWYLDRFNNVEWTPTTNKDVILVAYRITKPICAKIDKKITGSETIPVATAALRNLFVKASRHTGANIDVNALNCPGCTGQPSLCVEEPTHDGWAYYSLIEVQ